jgi:hypothetical protein
VGIVLVLLSVRAPAQEFIKVSVAKNLETLWFQLS